MAISYWELNSSNIHYSRIKADYENPTYHSTIPEKENETGNHFIQIWTKEQKPDKDKLLCMNSVLNTVQPGDSYTLISPNNFLKFGKKMARWLNINDYYNSDVLKPMLEKFPCKDSDFLYDVIKFYVSYQYRKIIIVDPHIELLSRPEAEKRSILLFITRNDTEKKCKNRDYFMYFNGNQMNFFRSVLLLSAKYSKEDRFYVEDHLELSSRYDRNSADQVNSWSFRNYKIHDL